MFMIITMQSASWHKNRGSLIDFETQFSSDAANFLDDSHYSLRRADGSEINI